MLNISKPLAVVATVLSLSAVLSACHFSDGEYGPASGGAGLPPASTVNTNGPVGANTTAPTTKLLGGSAAPKTATEYGGAGFPIPNYPPVNYRGYKNGVPTGPAYVGWRNSAYGRILATGSGYTLYMRLGDAFRHSGCFKECLRAFPPELTNGAPQASSGLLAADFGVLTANNSWEQVSYGGHPLYRYRGDTAPGQTNAEGKGGIWYVVGINGLPITHLPGAKPSTPAG